ncbi:hypothetical protein SALBM311S_01469 [Streptomyces alboniger]
MPLSRAVLAVITLFYAVGYWSAWFNASIYLNDQDMMPLQNAMIQLVQRQEAPVGLGQAIKTGQLSGLAIQMAVMVMALLPVAVPSPFVQKHFKKGMLTGAVKGSHRSPDSTGGSGPSSAAGSSWLVVPTRRGRTPIQTRAPDLRSFPFLIQRGMCHVRVRA